MNGTGPLRICKLVYSLAHRVMRYALYQDVADFLEQRGFRFQSRYNETVVDGKLVQADYLFVRSSP
jgi:hypothetical protein